MSRILDPSTFPTDEQSAVLDCPARITVVRACPGAGKTAVFVESIHRRLREWSSRTGGLAALSFTNVARQTIEERAGGAITPPHYVGTLDSFVFRYIVRPFSHLVGVASTGARLFPAVLSDQIEEPEVKIGPNGYDRTSVFHTHFCGGTEAEPEIDARLMGRRVAVPVEYTKQVLRGKEGLWSRRGIVTHSDCHYLASKIVNDPKHGDRICELLARRFPAILIDELQDTGWFLSRVFLKLFKCEKVSGLVVGDPDQAIYGFGGASPHIFDEFDAITGAESRPLSISQRCSKKVATLASLFTHSRREIKARELAPDGTVQLAVHSLPHAKLSPAQAKALQEHLGVGSIAVIARKGAVARTLAGQEFRDDFKGSSKAGRRLNTAVQHLLNGAPRNAAQLVQRELCRLRFGEDKVSSLELEEAGIAQRQLRSAVFNVLRGASEYRAGETWNEWLARQKTAIKDAAVSLGWDHDARKLASYKAHQDGKEVRQRLIDTPLQALWRESATVTTIHKVKGAEFDSVLLFVPKPHKSHAKCPSIEWWDAKPDNEEKRVAFVAISRAKTRFILCVHSQTYQALRKTRPEFVEGFGQPLMILV